MNRPSVILDDARRDGSALLCFGPALSVIRAEHPSELAAAQDAVDHALARGKHVAGYLSYEAGYLLEPRLAHRLPVHRQVPLLWLGVFEAPDIRTEPLQFFRSLLPGRAYAGPLRHEWSEFDYASRFAQAHELIAAGDIYQINLTFRSRFTFCGDALALYAGLRAAAEAPHCAYIDDGERHILSLSPELFFAVSADGLMTTKPMKGTMPRGSCEASDAEAVATLRASEKDRAENLMIVDLVRNDLGRIAEIGSVAVEKLFAVETYPTLHQMVSTVSAKLNDGTRASHIIRALFPSGSIVGTPKIRAMEIARDLEASPRGAYCGAIGYFAPDGSASFNVAIRTVTLCGDEGELGIGSAVVFDSKPSAEYAECLVKARYFESARKSLHLVETLKWSPEEGFVRLRYHLARMANSAAVFGISFHAEEAKRILLEAASGAGSPLRARLGLEEDGRLCCAVLPLGDAPARWRYRISSLHVSSADVMLRHKTSWREAYDAEHAQAVQQGCDEAVFLNENGLVTEGSRSNVFVKIAGQLLTPPLDCGLLNGCLRQELLDAAQCKESVLLPSDLAMAEAVYLGNSVRGLVPAFATDAISKSAAERDRLDVIRTPRV